MLAVVLLATVWAAGRQATPPTDTGTDAGTDAVRLGPEPGEAVAAYLARAATVPPGPGPRLALVQFDGPTDADAAAAALVPSGASPLEAVYRVPLPRVQTALRRVPLFGADPAAALRAGETRAAADAAGDVTRVPPGRAAAVARAEVAALGARCPCVLAVVVRVDPARVPATAGVAGVRAVQVAPATASSARLAVSPLLPEQGEGRPDGPVVGPVPDDGPVPGPS